jgi:UDP-glucose 4-epimerase
MDAALHLAVYSPFSTPDPAAEKEALDRAARGTFVLLHAALKAGVRRVVLASRLELMAAYPEEYAVDETWKPQPDATAAALAPYLAELTLREFVRAEELVGVCLRFGNLGSGPGDTTADDAARALERALTMDLQGRKYRWWLYHICSTDRYRLGAAAGAPLSFARSGG